MSVSVGLVTRRGWPVPLGPTQIATQAVSRRRCALATAAMVIQTAVGVCSVDAVRLGGEHEISPSGFFWRSADGFCYAVNTQPVSGGELVDSGLGIGTTITRLDSTTPVLSNAFVPDTVSGGG